MFPSKKSKMRDNEEIAVTTSNFETVGRSTWRRRSVSRKRCVPEIETFHKNIRDNATNVGNIGDRNDDLKPQMNNIKRPVVKGYNKLACEHRIQTEKLGDTNVAPGITLKTSEKDFAISKMHNEYRELERKYRRVREKYKKLNNLSVQREAEYRDLDLRYEKLSENLQELQETKISLFTRNQRLEIENARTNEDVMLLKQVVYRLNAELERYQDKLTGFNGKWDTQRAVKAKTIERVPNSADSKAEEERIIRSWGSVDVHVLGPLLNAYDENLTEKQDLVVSYEYAISNFGTECKKIVTENERMHKEVEGLRLKCDRYVNEVDALVKNTVSLKEQNDSLLHGVVDRKKKIQEICSSYQRKINATLERNEVLQREHVKTVADLSNLRGKYELLSKKLEETKREEGTTIPVDVYTSAIEESRRVTDELERRYEVEKRKLSARIKQMEEMQPETMIQLAAVTAERNHLRISIKSLRKNMKRMRRKNDHMGSVIHSMQISRDSIKKELSKTIAYCEQLFLEYERIITERTKLVSLLRETENGDTKIDHLGKAIAHRVDDLKNQLKIVEESVQQQAATIEERIKIQESRIDQMKREYRCKIRCLKNLIKRKDSIIGRLQVEKYVSHGSDVFADKPANDKKLTNTAKHTENHKS